MGRLAGRLAARVHVYAKQQRLAHLESGVAGRTPHRAVAATGGPKVGRPGQHSPSRLTRNGDYSERSATTGSTRAARRAGIHAARPVTASRRTTAAPKLKGSDGVMPKSMLLINRTSSSAAGTPMARPMRTVRKLPRTTSHLT